MISVTGFFRDPEAWAALDETVLAPLVAGCDADAETRIWVPACATGEEVYSLAMLVVERARATHNLRILATDSQETNLAVARDGVYPAAAVSAIPPERLRRFFDRLDGSYQIKKELRELRPAYQADTRQQLHAYPRLAHGAAHPDRRHQGRHHKARRAQTARASVPNLRQTYAHHRDLLAGATAQAPPDPTSGQDPDRHLMIDDMTISEPSPRKAVPLSGRSSAGHGSARSDAPFPHATAPPVFTDTSGRRSQEPIAPDLHRRPHRSTDPRC